MVHGSLGSQMSIESVSITAEMKGSLDKWTDRCIPLTSTSAEQRQHQMPGVAQPAPRAIPNVHATHLSRCARVSLPSSTTIISSYCSAAPCHRDHGLSLSLYRYLLRRFQIVSITSLSSFGCSSLPFSVRGTHLLRCICWDVRRLRTNALIHSQHHLFVPEATH